MSKADKSTRALQRVDTLLGLGRHAEAGRVASQVINADPRNGRAWALRGQALLGQRRYEAALAAARAATTVDPGAEYPHRLASVAHSALGRRHDAAQAAKSAIAVAPDHWATHYLYGQTLLAMDSLDEAQASAERAVALAPKRAEAHVGLGAVAAAQRRRDVAENAFRRALSLDPQNAAAATRLEALGSRPRAKGLGQARGAPGRTDQTRAPMVPVIPAALPESQEVLERRAGRVLSRTAYLISVLAAIVTGLESHGGNGAPVFLLVIPILYAGVFLRRLTPQERTMVFALIRRRSSLRVAAVLEVIALVIALGGSAAPSSRVTLCSVAIGAAAVARLLVFLDRRQTTRESGSRVALGIGNVAFVRLVLVVVLIGAGLLHQAVGAGTS